MSLLKKDRFSIRKIKGIVGSVFLGSLLFAPSVVGASTYHYLDYSNLTQTERDQLKQGRPDESKESYALVYEKDALPNTGQSQSIMTVFGLLTIGSLVVVITKDKRNKKIATFLIVGATGLVTLSTASALNLNANIHESGRDGVLQISGYRYVGYLELDDRSVSSVSPASTVSPVEQPKVVTDKGEPEIQPALSEAVVTEKGESEVQAEFPAAVVTDKDEPAVQQKLPEAVVTDKGEPEVQPALPEAVVTEKGEPAVQPALPKAVVTDKGEPKLQPALPKAVVTDKGEPELQPVLPEAVISEKVEPAVQPALPEAVVSEKGEPEVHPELPEAVVSEKVEAAVQPALPEAVISEKVEPAVQPELPVAVVSEKGEPEVQPALPEAVVTEKGEPEVQPALPEAVVTDKGEPEVQTSLSEAVVTEKGEALVHPELPVAVVSEKVEPAVQPELPEAVVSEKIEPAVQPELPEAVVSEKPEYTEPISTVSEVASEREELPSLHTDIRTETISKTTIEESDPSKFIGDDSVKQIGEDGERQIITSYEELHGKKISEPVETVTILKEMKPEILVKGTKEKPKEKTAPVLTLERTDTNVLDRSANLSYHLVNTDGVKINKITATIKDGNEIVKTVDLTSEQLDKQVEDLKFYKDYKIETTMTYDRGKGEETATLEEKPLRLDLKKVEIKNIASTNLVKVNDDGTETPSDFMTEKPSDEDVKKMYLKITSRDNKVTRLAVDKIELVTEKEKELYKITATAQDLIQHVDPSKTRNEYIHYIEKPRPKDDNVYYNFKDLVDAMNADKNGTFKLGADLNATNVPTPFKQYVPGTFKGHLSSVDGKQYTIHNIARPLFDRIENGSVKNINLGNVDINMPWADGIAPVANMVKNATVEDIKVTGSVIANNNIAGIVNKLDRGANMRNVAFIGKLHAGGDKGQNLAGIVGEIWKGNLDKAFVNATITGKRAKAAGIVSVSGNGMDNYTVGREGSVRHSVAKGTIDIENPVDVGGFISTNWVLGAIEDNVSMMKVSKGEIFFGSHNIDDEDGYFSGNRLNRDYVVKDVSTGLSSYQRSKRISTISQVEADKKIESYGISADKYEIHDPIVNTLNRLTRKEDEYKSTQDYKVDRDLAYRNIEKLQPFYNKEWIVNQGNKLAEDSNLAKKEVLSVTGMKDGQFVTDLSDIDHVMIHYADKTKEIKAVHQKESKVAQVREYSIDGLSDIVYTPNMVDKNRDQLIKDIKDRLATVELISPEVRALMGNRDRAEENTEERKNGYIRDLYLEESFAETKANLDKLVKSLIENADHQLNSDEAAMKALVKKVDENKAKIVMALTYLNRYYDIKYGDMTIKNLMMFKPDFYGKSVDLLDFLIRIGSSERNIKGDRTLDAYRDMIGGTIGKSELHGFLDYNMRLFTNDTDLNDWFIHAAKNVYVVEPKTTNPDFVNKRHRAFDGLNNGVHNRMILPLLTLKNAHIFLISTYNTMAYSSFEKYGKLTEESRNEFKKEIDKVAKGQQTYLDFWSRLALPNVRDRLLKSQNMVPTPVWDNQTYNGSPVGRRGFDSKGNPVAPIRELYGPTWRHHDRDWRMGAMASIFPNPNNDDKVLFMVTDMISQFGISAFTHETTHVNDRMLYFGGNSHREGTDVEAYAQGMLQTPDKSTGNGEYGALGLNMAYHRENDGDQWYNYNPDKLQTREDIDRYMKNYNEALMMLDHLEADAVLESGVSDINTKWFKKVDKAIRTIDNLNKLKAPNQWDKVRDLNEEEKAKKLSSINDLIDNNFMTKHGNPGNGIYRPEDFTPNSAYVNVNMMAGIYGGNTSDGAPGSLSFKHNAFRMWGYYGYENGFISYVSNKYKAEADKNNHGLLSDKLIINKVSQGNFKTLEEWKRHWYGEILVKAKKGFEAIDIDGTHISNYDELRTLFDKAVRKDLEGMSDPKIKDHFKNTVDLKSKVFKTLLKNTDGFFNPLFK
ncbi:Immunoglobulin A1 protease precursor [Streptococcus mitis]|uniref:Immunoglobulin A1 protease n=1 Tax=Streptococcus mitis TaxID=28037 RepID=A0A3R9LMI3_STRMT|nr:ZmpA/ZmpB/ZmpC family metallo-endopeptidase [Streptococcus mitis]RSK02904.1 Immunoglobulin A1 protease precursor [Streptococcus mitis]